MQERFPYHRYHHTMVPPVRIPLVHLTARWLTLAPIPARDACSRPTVVEVTRQEIRSLKCQYMRDRYIFLLCLSFLDTRLLSGLIMSELIFQCLAYISLKNPHCGCPLLLITQHAHTHTNKQRSRESERKKGCGDEITLCFMQLRYYIL